MSRIVGVAIVGLAVMAAQVHSQERYDPPKTPVLLDPGVPSFAPLDVEVDAFARIPQARAQFHVDGSGLAAVVIDTGINPQHASFQGRIIPGRNFSDEGDALDTADRDGHGSNVAGIIVGAALAPNLGLPTGIAPGAHVIPLKVFPGGRFEKINEALQWVIDQRGHILNERGVLISAVNLSLGNQTNSRSLDVNALPEALRRQCELIRALRSLDVAVTVAAGNHYFSFAPEQGMSFPAICPETTSVGAVFDSLIPRDSSGAALVTYLDGGRVFSTHPGRLTVFTQRLGSGGGGAFRTDVFAPGFLVTSAGPVPPAGSMQDPARTRTTQDGTSQASPVTAGVVLLLQQHFRNVLRQPAASTRLPSVELIERCLREGGVAIQDTEDDTARAMDNVTSSGAEDLQRLDAVSAITFLNSQLQPDLHRLQFELLKAGAGEAQQQVLERATILGRSAKDPQE